MDQQVHIIGRQVMAHELLSVLLLSHTASHSRNLVPTTRHRNPDIRNCVALTSCAGGVTNDVVALAWMASMTSSMATSFLAEPARSLKAYMQREIHAALHTGLGRDDAALSSKKAGSTELH